MLIMRCDVCGHEVQERAGMCYSEWTPTKAGFATIIKKYRPSPDIVDLCKPCVKKWMQAQREEQEREEAKKDGILARAWARFTGKRDGKVGEGLSDSEPATG